MARTRCSKGGNPHTYAFGIPELAAFFGMTESATRRAIRNNKFDPVNLDSIADFRDARRAAAIEPGAPPTKRARRRRPTP